MNISKFFIERPVFSAVLSGFILIAGLMALFKLPVSEYPEVVPPSIVVRASYPGANPQVISETVLTLPGSAMARVGAKAANSANRGSVTAIKSVMANSVALSERRAIHAPPTIAPKIDATTLKMRMMPRKSVPIPNSLPKNTGDIENMRASAIL